MSYLCVIRVVAGLGLSLFIIAICAFFVVGIMEPDPRDWKYKPDKKPTIRACNTCGKMGPQPWCDPCWEIYKITEARKLSEGATDAAWEKLNA
jgi:hypothetical protein